MNINPILEIRLPVSQEVPDENAFISIQNSIKDLLIPAPESHRILMIAMELFQNLKRHANHGHLALLRISEKIPGIYEISSMNFANVVSSKRLSGKHHELSETSDYRQHFREKLRKKYETHDSPGNLGLDICFRNSTRSKLKLVPFDKELNLIYLSFTLKKNGSTQP
jgi:hypothetical protein